MIIFTNYHGVDDLALCLAPANWRTPPKLTAEFPFTDIERAILGNETRRSFGLTKKHGLEYSPIFLNDFDSTAFRLGLNRLKTELVGVPLWIDLCVTHATLFSAGTSLVLNNLPARYGSHWILLAADGFTFEIVTVTAVNESTLTLTLAARTGPIWSFGSRIYPLLFGKFAERPQLESITPSVVEGGLRFIEDSDITEKISARSIGIDIVGSHIFAFTAYKLWTMQPCSEPRWIDTTEADILYEQLGFGRQDQAYPQQNWNRRGLEVEFDCRTRDEIAYVENCFNSRVGPVRPFFIPTWRNDLKLAADVAATDDTIEIEESRYEDAAYDDHPGSAFIALIDADGSVYPQRVTEVDLTTLTLESPVGEAHPKATTRISFLMLARFAQTTLEWEYISPARARVKIKFLELPDEYTDPQPDTDTWAYLFDFEETLPNATVIESRYTSYEDQIVFAGHTYLVAPLSLGERNVGLTLDDSCELKSWRKFEGMPLNRFLPYIFNAPLICTVTRVNAIAPNDGSARVLFVGQVTGITADAPEWTATLRDPIAVLLDAQYPRPLYQTQDNYDVYSAPTTIDPDDFKTTGVINNVANVTIITSDLPNDWFAGGWIQTGLGANQEIRFVLSSIRTASNIQTLILDRPLITAIVGQDIDMFAGYDGSREQRDTKFSDNIGFGGMPFIPDTNPSIRAADIVTPTGGKK
jgi:hypothetical protein